MKKLLFSFVVFSVLLIIGCQENSITNPVLNSEDVNKTSDSPITGTITLQGGLQNPYRVFNSYFVIDGAVNYQITVQQLDPIPPNRQVVISLQMNIDAELTNFCTVCSPPTNEIPSGSISQESSDVINITDDTQHPVSKTFVIAKRDDGMVLKCSFFVTTDNVTLDNMWLELPESATTASATNSSN